MINRQEVIQRIREQIPCTDYLEKSKGENMYCCPSCKSGTGKNGTGAVKYYPETNTWCCHACGAGYDVIAAYRLQTGTDFNEAISFLSETIGLEIASDSLSAPQSHESTQSSISDHQEENPAQIADFSPYYKECTERLSDPAAVSYLTARGISVNLARQLHIGFDPAADTASVPGAIGDEYKPHPCPRMIIPTSRAHYIARSIDPETPKKYEKLNPATSKGGGKVSLFNRSALKDLDAGKVIFVCEGWADAASFLMAGQSAIALNSKSNGKLLVDAVKGQAGKGSFVVVPDNDDNPETARKTIEQAQALVKDLREAGHRATVYNVAGIYHDANDSWVKDPEGFQAAIEKARAALLPGLLTTKAARGILEAVDDEYIIMPRFEQLSLMAKLKRHDTIVIAADTGAGKSSLALNFLYDLQDRYPALYINLEMDEATILQRLVAIHTGMELDRIEGYKNDMVTKEKVDTALSEILDRKEIQLLTDAYDLKTIENHIKIATHGRKEPTAVFIDTALLVTTGAKASTRYERFTHISEELRRISRMNNIIMFVLLQQNRSGKDDENKKPTNSSLKESGSWENDATKIMFLWYNPKTRQKEILVTKNRNGKSGTIELNYVPYTQEYSERK